MLYCCGLVAAVVDGGQGAAQKHSRRCWSVRGRLRKSWGSAKASLPMGGQVGGEPMRFRELDAKAVILIGGQGLWCF